MKIFAGTWINYRSFDYLSFDIVLICCVLFGFFFFPQLLLVCRVAEPEEAPAGQGPVGVPRVHRPDAVPTDRSRPSSQEGGARVPRAAHAERCGLRGRREERRRRGRALGPPVAPVDQQRCPAHQQEGGQVPREWAVEPVRAGRVRA